MKNIIIDTQYSNLLIISQQTQFLNTSKQKELKKGKNNQN